MNRLPLAFGYIHIGIDSIVSNIAIYIYKRMKVNEWEMDYNHRYECGSALNAIGI